MNTPHDKNEEAYQVSIEVKDEGVLNLPHHIVERLQPGCLVQVRILPTVLPDERSAAEAENLEWATLTARQFLAGYSDADAIYDELYG